MAKVRKVDFSPDEYLAGTMGMTHAERGLYWQVCALIYSTGGAISENDERLFRSTPDNPRTTRALLAKVLRCGKIERTSNGELMVNRCRKEIESATNRMRQSAEAGARGGRPAKQIQENEEDTKPNASPPEKPSPPHTTHHTSTPPSFGHKDTGNSLEPGSTGNARAKVRWSLDQKREFGWQKVAAAIGDGGWEVVDKAASGDSQAIHACKRIAKEIGVTWYAGKPDSPERPA